MGVSLQKVTIKGVNINSIYEESRQLPIISSQFIFQMAGAIKDKNLSGLATITAGMLNEGTKRLGNTKFSELLENNGINYSSSNGIIVFTISLDSLKENFLKGIELLAQLLSEPNLKQEVLNRVKKRVISSILQKKSNFDYVASKELKKLIFQNTPLANPKIGEIESIQKIQLIDVENFIKENLVLNKVIPTIAGDLNQTESINYISQILKVLPIGKFEKIPSFQIQKPQEKIIFKETKQAYIYFASPFNLKYNSENLYKAKVMFFILGSSGFGSRLMEKIRVEHGLAYSVYCSLNTGKSSNYMSGYLQTSINNLSKAKIIIQDEIKKFLDKGVTKEELESAKKFILGSDPLRTETLSSRIYRYFDEYYYGFEFGHTKKTLKLIESLSLDDLNKFIKKHREILNLSFSIVTNVTNKVKVTDKVEK